MAINTPFLPSRKGYVETEIDGARQYIPVNQPVLITTESEPTPTDIDLLADAYREGVNES